jgi:hypothetical protein
MPPPNCLGVGNKPRTVHMNQWSRLSITMMTRGLYLHWRQTTPHRVAVAPGNQASTLFFVLKNTESELKYRQEPVHRPRRQRATTYYLPTAFNSPQPRVTARMAATYPVQSRARAQKTKLRRQAMCQERRSARAVLGARAPRPIADIPWNTHSARHQCRISQQMPMQTHLTKIPATTVRTFCCMVSNLRVARIQELDMSRE